MKPPCSGSAVVFFSTAGRPVLPLSFGLSVDRGHAHSGGARNRRMAARTARTMAPVTAISVSWEMMARAWRTTPAPILISFSCRLVNHQYAMASGDEIRRKTLDAQYASADRTARRVNPALHRSSCDRFPARPISSRHPSIDRWLPATWDRQPRDGRCRGG